MVAAAIQRGGGLLAGAGAHRAAARVPRHAARGARARPRARLVALRAQLPHTLPPMYVPH